MNAIKNFKDNWILILAVAILGIGSGMVSAEINARTKKVEDAASVEYVNTENEKQDVGINKVNTRQDSQILELRQTKSDRLEVESIHEDVREIRLMQVKIYEILIDKK